MSETAATCEHVWHVVSFEHVSQTVGYRCRGCGAERFEPPPRDEPRTEAERDFDRLGLEPAATSREAIDQAIRECVRRYQQEHPTASLTPEELVALVVGLGFPEGLVRERLEVYFALREEFGAMRRTPRRRR